MGSQSFGLLVQFVSMIAMRTIKRHCFQIVRPVFYIHKTHPKH